MKSLLTLLLATALLAPAIAHEGEDHSAPEAVNHADAARRLPDGRVFVPKPVQRQWVLRTARAEAGEFPRSIELNGRVIADPQAGGRVQTLAAGRIEAGPQGIAMLGQTVKKGAVLALLHPAASALERGSQQALLADLAAQEAVLARRAERLKQLEGSVPQKEIEQAAIEVKALQQRKAAVAASLGPEALRAPVDGVVAAVHVAVGQVVDARTLAFEVIDPARLAVEALAYDPAQANALGDATAVLPKGTLPLTLVGQARSLREQALPVLFRVGNVGNGLPPVAIGQTLKVLASTRERQPGVAVPAAAVVRNAANESVVWLHAAPEHFTPLRVTVQPLDGQRVLVTHGLKGGEPLAVQGAVSLTQVK